MTDVSPNAVIAANVRRLRRARGWTQTDLAQRLTERDTKQWTVSVVSDAEGAAAPDAAERGRNRQFTVDEVNVLARVFQVTALALFVPTPDQLVRIGDARYSRDDYLDLVLQFPPEAAPPGFEHQLQDQYVERNRGTDRLLWGRQKPDDSGPATVAQALMETFLTGATTHENQDD